MRYLAHKISVKNNIVAFLDNAVEKVKTAFAAPAYNYNLA